MEYSDLNKVVHYSEATEADWIALNVPIAANVLVLANDTGDFKVGDGSKNYSALEVAFNRDQATEMKGLADKLPTLSGGDEGKILLVNEAGDGYVLSETVLSEFASQDSFDAVVGNYSLSTHNHSGTYADQSEVDSIVDAAYPEPLLGQDPLSFVILDHLKRTSSDAVTLDNSISDEFNDVSGISSDKSLNFKVSDGSCVTNEFYEALTGTSPDITHSASALVDGIMYLFGGNNSGATDDFRTYNIATDTWGTLSPFFSARYNAAACAVGTYIYLFGGYDTDYLNDFYIYDTENNTALQLTTGPGPIRNASLVNIDGMLYLYGGRNADNLANNEHWVYDTNNDEWTQLDDGPGARQNHAAVVVDSNYYVIMGQANDASYLDEVYKYNASTGAWTEMASAPNTGYGANVVAIDGIIYQYGSYNGSAGPSYLYAYDVVNNRWYTLADFAVASYQGCMEVWEGKAYLVNGFEEIGATYRLTPNVAFNVVSKTNTHTSNVTMSRMYARGVLPDLNTNTIVEVSRDGGENFAVIDMEESELTQNVDLKAYVGNTEFTHVAEKQVLDLSSAIFMDHKGDLTTFVVDTANTYGHTATAISDAFVGAKLSTASGDIVIDAVTGDGTASANVEFTGTLATGSYTVLSVVKAEYDAVNNKVSPITEYVSKNSIVRVPLDIPVVDTKIRSIRSIINSITQIGDDAWNATTAYSGDTNGRGFHTAVVIGDEMIVYAGWTGGGSGTNTLIKYNFITNTWSTGTTYSGTYGGVAASAVVYSREMYVYGGYLSDTTDAHNKLRKYNPDTDTWTTLTANPNDGNGRYNHTAVIVGDKMYVYCGFSGAASDYKLMDMHVYDIINDSWSVGTTNTFGNASYGHTKMKSVVYNDEIYIYGGFGGAANEYSDDLFKYNPSNDTWYLVSTCTSALPARMQHAMIVHDDKIYIYGGINSTTIYSTTLVYDLIEEEWLDPISSVYVRSDHTMCVHDNRFYVYGGRYNTSSYTNYMQYYAPIVQIEADPSDSICSLVKVGTSYYGYRGDVFTEMIKYVTDTWYYLNSADAWIASTNTLVDDVIIEALAVSENQTPISILKTKNVGIQNITELAIAWIGDENVSPIHQSYLLNHVPTSLDDGADVCYRVRNLIKDETLDLKGVRLNWY